MSNEKNFENFSKKIKVYNENKNIEYAQKKFMDSIKKNPDLIEYISGPRLDFILEYFKKENEKLKKLLK